MSEGRHRIALLSPNGHEQLMADRCSIEELPDRLRDLLGRVELSGGWHIRVELMEDE